MPRPATAERSISRWVVAAPMRSPPSRGNDPVELLDPLEVDEPAELGEAHLHHLEELGPTGQVGDVAVTLGEGLEGLVQARRTGQRETRDHAGVKREGGSPGDPGLEPIRLTLYPVLAKLSTKLSVRDVVTQEESRWLTTSSNRHRPSR